MTAPMPTPMPATVRQSATSPGIPAQILHDLETLARKGKYLGAWHRITANPQIPSIEPCREE